MNVFCMVCVMLSGERVIGDSCVISAACDNDSWVISAMGYGKCSPV